MRKANTNWTQRFAEIYPIFFILLIPLIFIWDAAYSLPVFIELGGSVLMGYAIFITIQLLKLKCYSDLASCKLLALIRPSKLVLLLVLAAALYLSIQSSMLGIKTNVNDAPEIRELVNAREIELQGELDTKLVELKEESEAQVKEEKITINSRFDSLIEQTNIEYSEKIKAAQSEIERQSRILDSSGSPDGPAMAAAKLRLKELQKDKFARQSDIEEQRLDAIADINQMQGTQLALQSDYFKTAFKQQLQEATDDITNNATAVFGIFNMSLFQENLNDFFVLFGLQVRIDLRMVQALNSVIIAVILEGGLFLTIAPFSRGLALLESSVKQNFTNHAEMKELTESYQSDMVKAFRHDERQDATGNGASPSASTGKVA